jgi:hypothetical protein
MMIRHIGFVIDKGVLGIYGGHLLWRFGFHTW